MLFSCKEVRCAVVTRGDECVVRLTAEGTGELFAECPVPKDQPLTTVSTPDHLHIRHTCTAEDSDTLCTPAHYMYSCL